MDRRSFPGPLRLTDSAAAAARRFAIEVVAAPARVLQTEQVIE
jgi:hypothetical protein